MFLELTDWDGAPITINCDGHAKPAKMVNGTVVHTSCGTFLVRERYGVVSCLLQWGKAPVERAELHEHVRGAIEALRTSGKPLKIGALQRILSANRSTLMAVLRRHLREGGNTIIKSGCFYSLSEWGHGRVEG